MSKKNNSKKSRFFKQIFVYIILIMLLIIGGYLRGKGIFEGSFSFTYDIGRDLLEVSNIVTTLKPTLIGPTTGMEGLFYGPWWYYFLVVPFVLFKGDPTGITFFIALIGTINIVLGFLLGRKISDNFLGITLASFIASSQYMIGLSTQIWSPNLIPTFMILMLLLIVHLIQSEKPKMRALLFLGLLLGLILEMEIFFGLLFFISTMLFLIFFLRKKISKDGFLLFVAGFGLIEIPRILFDLRHEFLTSKVILKFFSGPSHVSLDAITKKSNFVELQYVTDNVITTTLAANNTLLGYLFIVLSIFIFIQYFKHLTDIQKKLIGFILITFALFYIVFLLYAQGLWGHYLAGLPILLILFVALAIDLLRKKFIFGKIAYLIPIVFIWANVSPITGYLESKRTLWEGDAAVYRNQVQVVDYVYKKSQGKDFKYVVYTPPIHDYTYRYLFPWYGKKYYNKVPSSKANLAFFIIEPDDAYWLRRVEWLENRKRDGTIIKEEYLKGFILVQTRIVK